jgi:YVTN family beta-propeller protein
VLLYVQPFPQEADRLRFKIESISVRRSDDTEFPVSMKLTELRGREMTGQRLLGTGVVPPGSYTGFSIKIKEAMLRVEDGEAALLLPDAPVRIDFPFNVSRKRGYVVWFELRPGESLKTGFSFSPAFSVFMPARPIAGLTGYATNSGSNNISVFNKRTGQVTGVIATRGGPTGMALDQRGRKAYVALPGQDMIEVIDVNVGEVMDRIMLNTGDRPRELALTPDGRVLLSANTGSNTVSVIETPTLFESRRITVGNGPNSILVDPSGRRAYVFNSLASSISVLDIPNKALLTTISTDPGPLRGQFNKRGDRFYVIHELSSYLSIIDGRTLSTVKRVNVGMGMNFIKVDTVTDLLYMGRTRDATVGVYEPNSFVPMDYIRTDGGTRYLTIDVDENNLVMVGAHLPRLTNTNLVSRKSVVTLDIGDAPYWVTVMGER